MSALKALPDFANDRWRTCAVSGLFLSPRGVNLREALETLFDRASLHVDALGRWRPPIH